MKYCFSIACFLFLSGIIHSQSLIKGVVQSLEGPISGASVTIKQTNTENILAYDITDREGKYEISLSSEEKKLTINVRSLGYGFESKSIENKAQTINFILYEEVTQLKEVAITPPPIRIRGDTISFNVKSFASEKDRTLSDVLKKMPGITVKDNGQILYKGEPITKYYIEGLDLLEGRYGLANENLPYDRVSKVEVLENHQPIKALDSLVFSDKAALNIKLKKKVTLTGQAKLGVGFPPLLWEANLTPMLFAKKQQMIASYQINNIGVGMGNQFRYLIRAGGNLSNFEDYNGKTDWLFIEEVNSPNGFLRRKQSDNNIHNALTTNYLRKLKKDYEFRVNIYYLNDYQKKQGISRTLTFTPTDTISIMENIHNKSNSNILQTNFSIERNLDKKYFRNSLQLEGSWDRKQADVILNNKDTSNQKLTSDYFKISNELNTMFTVGKQLINFNSSIGFDYTPQKLTITPGQFQEILNNGKDYDRMAQNVNLKTLYVNNSIGFTKAVKRFTFFPEIGVQILKQDLESDLATKSKLELDKNFFNHLDWRHTKTYFDLRVQYRKNKWRVELNAPINYRTYDISDKPLEKRQNLNRFTFEPSLSINNKLNAYWNVNSSYGISNKFGTINKIHYGYIVQSYRSLQRLDAPLPKTYMQNFQTIFSYKNPIRSLFGNISYSFSNSKNNLLFSSQISENGEKKIEAIQKYNNSKSHNISGRISKYLRKLKTNFALGSSFSLHEFRQIINKRETDVKNQDLNLNMNTNVKLFDWMGIEYRTIWSFSRNRVHNTKNKTIINRSHSLDISVYPIKNHYIGINSEYSKNDSSSNDEKGSFFTDLLYRYTWKKKKIDFELQWNNVLNAKHFNTSSIDLFNYVETNFNLRPSQILFKVRFSI